MEDFHSTTSLRESVYSFRCAQQAVNGFAHKYARVINFVAKKLFIEPKSFLDLLIKVFMRDNASWNILRETLKRIDKYNMYGELQPYFGENMIKYLTSVKCDVIDDWLEDKISIRTGLTGRKI